MSDMIADGLNFTLKKSLKGKLLIAIISVLLTAVTGFVFLWHSGLLVSLLAVVILAGFLLWSGNIHKRLNRENLPNQ